MLPKAPHADLRRSARARAQIGTAAALGLCVLAFTVPTPPAEPARVLAPEEDAIQVADIDPTRQVEPPPPPPPAPPPPQEVPDDAIIEDVIEDIEIDFDEPVIGPSAPPAPPPPPPPPARAEAPPPPPPPVADAAPDSVFVVVEHAPELIGGLEGLQRRVVYPELPRRAGVQGTVTVQFVVDESGRVSEARAVRSPNDNLSQAAIKAVVESEFKPGMQRGRPVKVRYTLPVRFVLR